MASAPEAESKGTTPIPLEVLVVDQESARELQCGICLQILTKPQQCKNGHLFCHHCILQHIKKTPECPHCRTQLREVDLARALFVERHIRQLRVYCKYHFCRAEDELQGTSKGDTWIEDVEGCGEIETLENIGKHEAKCNYGFVACKFSNKCEKIRRKDLERHERICVYRPLECPHCKFPIESNKMEEHLIECKMIPVNCDRCNKSFQRGELEQHKKMECSEELIPCQFQEQGCNVKILRKEMKNHLTEEVGSHLMMMKKAFDDQIQVLKQNYETALKGKDEKIKSLEKSLTEIDTKIEWRVKNWSTVKKKSYLQSDKFSFAEFSWFIGFYSDGDNEESRGYISVYLFLDVANMPKGKSVTVEFLLKFVNHKDPNESVRKEFKTTFPIKGGQGWGDRKAIKSARITEESGFLKQDTLFVESQIILKKVQWLLH